MCGSAFWITSPSISSTSRNTPWAAGCCGPKLSVKLWNSVTAARPRRAGFALLADHFGHGHPRLDADGLVHDPATRGVVAHLHPAGERKVLAEWMADETVIREDPPQVGVAPKQDAVEVEGLALVPIRRRPHAGHGIDHRRLGGGAAAAQPQARIARDGQ